MVPVMPIAQISAYFSHSPRTYVRIMLCDKLTPISKVPERNTLWKGGLQLTGPAKSLRDKHLRWQLPPMPDMHKILEALKFGCSRSGQAIALISMTAPKSKAPSPRAARLQGRGCVTQEF